MKTNKTFEQYKAESLDELANLPTDIKATIVAGLRNCWNAALASVVEEPVLTQEEGVEILIHALNMPDAGTLWAKTAMKRLLSAGRIPASKPDDQERLKNYEAVLRSIGAPEILCTGEMGQLAELDEEDMAWAREQGKKIVPTPQQEGGLTREWLAQYIKQDPDAITGILTRHTQALEAIKKEAWEQFNGDQQEKMIQANQIEALRAKLASVTELLTDRVDDCELLTQQLAEAKEGRYAIGELSVEEVAKFKKLLSLLS